MAVGTDVVRLGRPDLVQPGTRGALPWWGIGGFNPFFLWALMGWVLAAMFVLRNTWKPERILDPTPTRIERFRVRNPVLGGELRLSGGAGLVVLIFSVGVAASAWLSLDDVSRYAWAVVAIVAGVGFFLASWNDL